MTVGTKQTDRLLGFSRARRHLPRARPDQRVPVGRSLPHLVRSVLPAGRLFSSASGGQTDPGKTFTPGERVTENWGGFPLHVAPNVNLLGAQEPAPSAGVGVADRQPRWGVFVTPFSDNTFGDTGSGYAPDPARQVLRAVRDRREREARSPAAASIPKQGYRIGFGTAVPVSPKPSVIRFLLTATRAGERVSAVLGQPHRVDVAFRARGRADGAARLGVSHSGRHYPVLRGGTDDDVTLRGSRAGPGRLRSGRAGRCCG